MQETELNKSIGKLSEARMVAHAYMRIIEERTDIIRALESQLERSAMKQVVYVGILLVGITIGGTTRTL